MGSHVVQSNEEETSGTECRAQQRDAPPPVTHGPYLVDGDEEGGGGGGGEGEVGARAEVDGDGADCEASTTVAWREGVCGGGESEGDSGGARAATEEAS